MTKITIRPGKGQHHNGCICVDNIDLQTGRCAVTHDKDGKFVKENACSYCYAKYLYKDKYDIKESITTEYLSKEIKRREAEKTKLKDSSKTVKSIRLGKMFDLWDPLNVEESRKTLLSVINSANELDLPLILITKLLPFDRHIADALLKSRDSVLHYSLGSDKLELGAVALGMNNKNRIKEAKKYIKAGINVYLRVVADVVQPMPDEIKDVEKLKIPLLITPLRYNNIELFEKNTGLNWEEAKQSTSYKFEHGALRPEVIHESWGDKDKHAYCGVVGAKLGCNACGLYKGRKMWITE